MDALEKYFNLMQQRPEIFRNPEGEGVIKIITDRQRILEEQAKILEKLRADGKPDYWIDIGVLAEDSWSIIVRDLVEFPDGHISGYVRWLNRRSQEQGSYNVVLMCVRGDEVLLIRKFDHDARDFGWEFPRGFGESGLSSVENARKELEEEVGITNASFHELTTVHEGAGGTTVYRVEVPLEQKVSVDLSEGISAYRWVSKVELEEIVLRGQLRDYFSYWAFGLVKIKS